MQRALDTHDTVLRALLARYYGYEVTTEGDSFTMAFHDPVDAVLLLYLPSNHNNNSNNNNNKITMTTTTATTTAAATTTTIILLLLLLILNNKSMFQLMMS